MADRDLIGQWVNGLRIWQMAHMRASAWFGRMHFVLGVPVTVLAAVIGTSLFADTGQLPPALRYFSALASIAVAVLSALQTFFNYPQRANQHAATAAKFGALRRRLETAVAFPGDSKGLAEKAKAIQTEWAELEESMPVVPQRFYDEAQSRVRSFSAPPPPAAPEPTSA
jgi:hypothetical protein